VKIRLIAAGALAAAALLPMAGASANTGCRYFPGSGVTDPDVVGTACATGAAAARPLCEKYNFCFE
jgi:hypothetical protein